MREHYRLKKKEEEQEEEGKRERKRGKQKQNYYEVGVGDEVEGYDLVKLWSDWLKDKYYLNVFICVEITQVCAYNHLSYFTHRFCAFYFMHVTHFHPTPRPHLHECCGRVYVIEIPRFCFERKVWTVPFTTAKDNPVET